MKISIQESYPGEMSQLSDEDIEDKLHKAIASVQRHPRGGELQLIEDLASESSFLYAQRMRQMLDDFAELEASGEI